jgi:hypothetical protein
MAALCPVEDSIALSASVDDVAVQFNGPLVGADEAFL